MSTANHRLDIPLARLAFPNLWKATTVNGEGQPAFSASLLIEPDSPTIKKLEAAIDACAKEKWGAKAPAILAAMRKTDKTCLHDGDSKSQYQGFEGMKFVSARTKTKPRVVDRSGAEVSEADGIVYSGCYVLAKIELWAQDNKYGKRVNATLRGIQFVKKGDAFAGGSAPADEGEFDDLGVPDEEEGIDPAA